MDRSALHQWQQTSINTNNNNCGSEARADRGVQNGQTIVFSQNVGFSRSSTGSYQHPRSHNSSKAHYTSARTSKSAPPHYKKQQATAGAYHYQIRNNQGQTFADQTQVNQQTGCNVNHQVIQYNINVGNLPENRTHVNQVVCLQQQQQEQEQQHGKQSITPLQLQQSRMLKGQHPSSAYNPKLAPENTHQYFGGLRRTLVDLQHESLSAQQYFRSNSAELSLETQPNKNQYMKPGAYKSRTQIHSESDKYLNLPSTTPGPFVNIAKGQTTAKHKVQRQRSSPPNQQYGHFYYSPAVTTQYQQTPHQHAAIPTQDQQLPPAYSTILTPFEQQPHLYSTVPTQSQQLSPQLPLQCARQQPFIELQRQQNKPCSTLQQPQQTERVSPQQNQRSSPSNQRESLQTQQVSPQAPNPPPQSSPQLQQPSLGEQLTRVVTSDSNMRSTTTGGDHPYDLTLDDLLNEVEGLNKTRINLEDRSSSQQTTSNWLSPFNQRKSQNNEICDDIQIVNCFSLQGKVDSNSGKRLTSQEVAAKTARNHKVLQSHSPALEPGYSDDANSLLLFSTNSTKEKGSDDRLLPRIVARFLGKDVSDVRSRDYVMYALSDDPRVAEATIAAHSQESTEMFVCLEFPPRSRWSGGAREAKKAFCPVKNVGDVSCIVNLYSCTSVRMVLVVVRMSQRAERMVQHTRPIPQVDLTTSRSDDGKTLMQSEIPQPSSVPQPPAEQSLNVQAVSNPKTPLTRPSTIDPLSNSNQARLDLDADSTIASDERLSSNIFELLMPNSIPEPPVEQTLNTPAIFRVETPPTRPAPVNEQQKSPTPKETEEQGSKMEVSSSETPSVRPSPVEHQLNHFIQAKTSDQHSQPPPVNQTIQERAAEQSEDKSQLASPVDQSAPPSCSIESEEEKMTRIRKEVEALLNAGKPDLRKAAAKRSRGDPELLTLDRFRRKWKSRGIDLYSRSAVSDVTIREKSSTVKHRVDERILSVTDKGHSSSPTKNDVVISQHTGVTAQNVIVKVERDEIDYDLYRGTTANRYDITSTHYDTEHGDAIALQDDDRIEFFDVRDGHNDIRTEHEDFGANYNEVRVEQNDVISEHDDVISDRDDFETDCDDIGAEKDDVRSQHDGVIRCDDEMVSLAKQTPGNASLNCGKAAKRSENAVNANLRKRKRASMRAGSCRAPRLDLVYRSYLDSLQPSPIVPRQCAPHDVTIIPCSVRISDIFSLNTVA